jgi:hypothetical protein
MGALLIAELDSLQTLAGYTLGFAAHVPSCFPCFSFGLGLSSGV